MSSPPLPKKPSVIRRVTSKLNIAIPHGLRPRPSVRTLTDDPPSSSVSRQHREAALRERGLLPPHADTRPSATSAGSTEAERVKADWLASSSAHSDPDPPRPPAPSRPQSPPQHAGVAAEPEPDLPCPARPSCCGSLPPLSTSHLEILHEDPSEQSPVTPPPILSPTRPPIIVSSPTDSPSSPTALESPVSCSFSSTYPGSTLDSHSHSHSQSSEHPPPVPKKDYVSRRRTTESGLGPRKAVGSALSGLGTRSLSNLRRSMAESLARQSTTTLSSADLPQVPRIPINPTVHSLGSIIRETKDIEDAESRRLCELAFLD